jgi:hypothetical protein
LPFSVSQTNTQTNPINNQTNNTSRPQKTFPGNKEQIPPLHIPLNEMYQRLLSIGQVAPVSLTPLQKSFLIGINLIKHMNTMVVSPVIKLMAVLHSKERSFNSLRSDGLPLMNPRM